MPTVPAFGSMGEYESQQPASGLMGGKGVTPEHVLMAAEAMHSRGALVDTGQSSGIAMPHRAKSSGGRRIKSRAEGGPVEADEPYLVGEHGPEVVVPEKKGKVIPNEEGPTWMELLGSNPQELPTLSGTARQLANTPQWAWKDTPGGKNLQTLHDAFSGKKVDDEDLVNAIQASEPLNLIPRGIGNLLRALKILPEVEPLERQWPKKKSKDLQT